MLARLRIYLSFWSFTVLFVLTVGAEVCPAQNSLSALVGNDLRWDKLPIDLSSKVVPLLDKEDLHLKFGKTPDGEEYLSIGPPRKSELSFGVRDPLTQQNGFIVSAKRAYYWPGRGLLRFKRDVIVSASACRLEGTAFDLHLRHETTRLSGPNIVVSLAGGLLPVESDSVRIAGLIGAEKPLFEWDPIAKINDRPVLHRPVPKHYPIQIRDGGRILFEGQELELAEFESKIRNLAANQPDSKFTLELEPAASSEDVNKVKKTLQKSGFDVAETRAIQPDLERNFLSPENENPVLVEPDSAIPNRSGAALLWVQGDGQYLLNGKSYDAGSIRTLMRRLAKGEPDHPVIVAGAENVPQENLRSLAQDLRAFGFKYIQLGMAPSQSSP
jgi:biopolymer transport protein ExbD